MADCKCGKTLSYATKAAARKMLARGTCRHCSSEHRSVAGDVPVYRNDDGKWCSKCSGCGAEQAYTRLEHAKQSELSDWQCKKCVAAAKRFSNNLAVGPEGRMYNKFKRSAESRGIQWGLTPEEFAAAFDGKCQLTGWSISMCGERPTASLDRIDSGLGYTPSNVQWVHAMVNMCKNKYSQDLFVSMCEAVADRVKW